jgi:hypothetical protein
MGGGIVKGILAYRLDQSAITGNHLIAGRRLL